MAFADDLFIIADNPSENALKALDLLKNYSLNINLKKSKIISDQKDMKGVTEICGVKFTEKIRYLGVYL